MLYVLLLLEVSLVILLIQVTLVILIIQVTLAFLIIQVILVLQVLFKVLKVAMRIQHLMDMKESLHALDCHLHLSIIYNKNDDIHIGFIFFLLFLIPNMALHF